MANSKRSRQRSELAVPALDMTEALEGLQATLRDLACYAEAADELLPDVPWVNDPTRKSRMSRLVFFVAHAAKLANAANEIADELVARSLRSSLED